MRARDMFWMASAMAMCLFLGAASAWAEPAPAAAAAGSSLRAPKLQLGIGVYVGTVSRISDRRGRILKAEFTTDRGKILIVRLQGQGLELARKSRGKKVEVNGKATMFASNTSHGIELVVERWKPL